MTLAILCSGQGHQQAGMFDLLADVPTAAPLFEAAGQLLDGRDPRELVRDGSSADLTRNRTAQILCVLQAVALQAALDEALPSARLVAGYSVGEVSAWALAGALEPTEALRLVAERAEAMDAASGRHEGLLFVRGLDEAQLAALCKSSGVEISIVNPGDGYVVGGTEAGLTRLAEQARAKGAAHTSRIDVHVASHTSHLRTASTRFGEALSRSRMKAALPNGTRLFSGVDGEPVFDLADGRRKLAMQISQTVQWAACLEACREAGADIFLETGPGDALAKMAAQVAPDSRARSAGEFRTLQGLKAWVTSKSS